MSQTFQVQWDKAKAAAQAAGDAWIAAGKHDWCGNAYVETKLNTAFGRWVKKTQPAGVVKWLHFHTTWSGKQDQDLHVTMAKAAKKSLEADGITGLSIYSWVD